MYCSIPRSRGPIGELVTFGGNCQVNGLAIWLLLTDSVHGADLFLLGLPLEDSLSFVAKWSTGSCGVTTGSGSTRLAFVPHMFG